MKLVSFASTSMNAMLATILMMPTDVLTLKEVSSVITQSLKENKNPEAVSCVDDAVCDSSFSQSTQIQCYLKVITVFDFNSLDINLEPIPKYRISETY